MDYKEKYNTALERARKIHHETEFDYEKGMMEEIFPELKEPNDERIRKELIAIYSVGAKVNAKTGDIPDRDIVAWLEKQGEQHPHVDVNKMVDKFAHTEVEGYGFPSMIEVDAYRKGIEDVLEKQSEQEPYGQRKKCSNCQFNYAGECKGFCQMKRDEQKPIDKVEPKFKVGDWVVYDHRPYQVVELPKEGYINLGLRRNEKVEYAPSPYCRHWTIADAKNGDVISYKGEISLYKHDIKNCTKQETTFGGFVYHCCYDGKRFITDSLYSLTEQDKMDIHPATKEQRDLLFQKMADAGYEFVNGHVTRF